MSRFPRLVIGWIMISVIFALVINYFFNLSLTKSVYFGFVTAFFTIVIHECSHELVAKYYCKYKTIEFELTKFAIGITLFSIFIISLFEFIKNTYGWQTYFLPILASPGAVYVDKLRQKGCADDVAIAGPLSNFIVGIITLFILFSITKPPFVLNTGTNLSLLALISYFSFVLAFFNALPIKIGDIAFDGWYAITLNKDKVSLILLDLFIVVVSVMIVFTTGWWIVQVIK